jgi:hypothetical protein
MGFRKCTVSYCDVNGVEHSVEVSADSLYEAVAQGLRVFRENDAPVSSRADMLTPSNLQQALTRPCHWINIPHRRRVMCLRSRRQCITASVLV